MGCGGSKLEPEQEARLRPILRRRLEEFMVKRNTGLSKKPLLGTPGDATIIRDCDGGGEEEVNVNVKEDITASPLIASDDAHACLPTQDCPPTPQIITPTVDNNNDPSILSPNVEGNYNVDNATNNNVDDKMLGNVVNNNKDDDMQQKNSHEIETSKGSSHKQEEECACDDIERMELLSPGSPSFRVYCVHSLDEEHLDDIPEHLDLEECIEEDDEAKCLRQESSSSNNEVSEEKHASKKRKRGRKFKMIAIPKGGRNILHNMHSFYNFPCNSHNSHLMQQAAA